MKKLSILFAAVLVAIAAFAEKGAVILYSPLQYQVTNISPNGKWACGILGDGIMTSLQAMLWNLETGETTVLTTDESSAWDVTDEGWVVGTFTDHTLSPAGIGMPVAGIYKDGEWTRLDNSTIEGVELAYAEAYAISADGRVVVGYVQNGPSDSNLAPAKWVDGKLERLYPFQKAGVVYDITADGKYATGWTYQPDVDGDLNRTVALWTDETVENLSESPSFAEAGRKFSPNGKWLVCEAFGHKFLYNMETKEKTQLPWINPNCWKQIMSYVSDEGIVLGGEESQDPTTGASDSYGYVWDGEKAMRHDEWLKQFNVEIDDNEHSIFRVVGMSDDGKTIIFNDYPCENGIPVGDWASIAVKLDQEVTAPAPVALHAIKLQALNNVRLTWKAPLVNVEPVGYNIYRDGNLLMEGWTEMAYIDAELADGDYSYTVTALYEGEGDEFVESEHSVAAVVTVAADPLNTVQHLQYKSTNYNELRLRWNAPDSNLPSVKYYDSESAFAGFGGGVVSFLVAIKMEYDMVENYANTHAISRVAFMPRNNEAIYTIRVMVDGVEAAAKTVDNATLVYNAMNTVVLDNPVRFEANDEVLVVVDVDATKFTVSSNDVVGCTYGSVVAGFSDLLRQASESEFYSLNERSLEAGMGEMPISWAISAIFSKVDGNGVADDNHDVVVGYDVYRNGEYLATTTENNYLDSNLTDGTHTMGIVTKYAAGESAPANVVIDYKCNTEALKAVDKVAVFAGTTDMSAFWSAPLKNDETFISYAHGTSSGKGISLAGGTDFIEYAVAHDYPYSFLDWYEGYTIDALRFYPSAEATFAIALEVNGVDHEFIVLEEMGAENGYTLNTWNTVKLSQPYTIKQGDAFRVKLLCTDVDPSTYPITLDNSAGILGVSDLYSWDYYSAGYSSAMSDGGHNKGNWMIGMLVSNGSDELLPVEGYNVLVDGEQVNDALITDVEYKATGLAWEDGDTHRIKVNTIYNINGEEIARDGKQVVFNVKAGVESIEVNRVNVYPNPATAYINVEGEVEQLVLFDMNGRRVAESQEATIDVTALATGNYLLNIYANGSVRTVKVLIAR